MLETVGDAVSVPHPETGSKLLPLQNGFKEQRSLSEPEALLSEL